MDARELDNHKKILGIIYLITAGLTVCIVLFAKAIVDIVFGFAFDHASSEERQIAELVRAVVSILPAVLIVFSALPTLIAGIGLLTRQSWAPLFALIMGCLKLFSVPIGTAIGIYAIWVYAEDQKAKRAVAA